ncbi:hypothetical protein EST38_g11435 [Candolleomyces aberdarensis]|uniref:Uncharacterized protein n=1 Tax=Candolleomyces aberdarensis TaxID=2316362 RepID=A0A4Q2D854_9AGAR|nr:hypothetical protein EST38_g11435 [Candolleomyces aberdarensis]
MRSSQKGFRWHFKTLMGNAKSIHLDQQRERRWTALNSLVKGYQSKSIHPSEWAHFPRQLLHSWDGGILPKNFDPSMPDSTSVLVSELSNWYQKVRDDLVEKVRLAYPTFVESPVAPELEFSRAEAALDLAVVVLSCANCLKGTHHLGAALVGWDNILTHICSSSTNPSKWHGTLHWSERGHASALALVELVGKDPRTTTAEDMDKLDARFFCGYCEYTDFTGVRWRKALKWRECLTHVLYCVKPGHDDTPQTWLLLSEEAAQSVKAREKPYPLRNRPTWGCGLCTKHLETPEEYAAVVNHITTEFVSFQSTHHFVPQNPSISRHADDVDTIAELEIGHELVCFPNLFTKYLEKPKLVLQVLPEP